MKPSRRRSRVHRIHRVHNVHYVHYVHNGPTVPRSTRSTASTISTLVRSPRMTVIAIPLLKNFLVFTFLEDHILYFYRNSQSNTGRFAGERDNSTSSHALIFTPVSTVSPLFPKSDPYYPRDPWLRFQSPTAQRDGLYSDTQRASPPRRCTLRYPNKEKRSFCPLLLTCSESIDQIRLNPRKLSILPHTRPRNPAPISPIPPIPPIPPILPILPIRICHPIAPCFPSA